MICMHVQYAIKTDILISQKQLDITISDKSPCIIALYNSGSKAPIKLLGGEVLFNTTVKRRMFGLGIVLKEIGSPLFNLVYLIVFLTKLLEIGCLG